MDSLSSSSSVGNDEQQREKFVFEARKDPLLDEIVTTSGRIQHKPPAANSSDELDRVTAEFNNNQTETRFVYDDAGDKQQRRRRQQSISTDCCSYAESVSKVDRERARETQLEKTLELLFCSPSRSRSASCLTGSSGGYVACTDRGDSSSDGPRCVQSITRNSIETAPIESSNLGSKLFCDSASAAPNNMRPASPQQPQRPTETTQTAPGEIKLQDASCTIEVVANDNGDNCQSLGDCSVVLSNSVRETERPSERIDCICEKEESKLSGRVVANLDAADETKLNYLAEGSLGLKPRPSGVHVCECSADQAADGRIETSLVGYDSSSSNKFKQRRGERSTGWSVGRNSNLILNHLGIDRLIQGLVRTSRQTLKSTNKHLIRFNYFVAANNKEDNKLLAEQATNERLQCDSGGQTSVRRDQQGDTDKSATTAANEQEEQEKCRWPTRRNRRLFTKSMSSNDTRAVALEHHENGHEKMIGKSSREIQNNLRDQAEELNRVAIMSQQREKQNKFSSSRYEDRRSTYCSSIGALTTTDFNYDSSVSSSINCTESHHQNCSNLDGNMRQQQQLNSCPIELDECNDAPTAAKGRSSKKTKQGTMSNNNNKPTSNRNLPPQPNPMFHNRQQCQITINEKKLIEKSTPPPGGKAKNRDDEDVNGGSDDNDDDDEGNFSSSKDPNSTQKNPIKKRENWDKNIEFLLAVIGFAVDLGNVWRFPYICYKNGGGAFLIPYTIMFILGGLPIFYLEMSLGQYFSSGCLTVWRRVCPMAKGIGYAMCVLNFFTGLYYNTIISWAVFFFVESFRYKLPWTSCDNQWNSLNCKTMKQRQETRQTPSLAGSSLSNSTTTSFSNQTTFSTPTKDYFEREVLQNHLSQGIDDLGFIRKPLAIYLALVFICIYFAIWKGVKSTGKAVWITALLPYFVLIPLLIRGVFLEGAWLGIKYYLYPDWAKIIDVDVWVEAAKQIYFSLGPGFGTLMALSSYNKFNHNCRRDALIAAAVNYFASFISGLVIFAVLGYMATIESVGIEDVATEGPGLVFQVYPEGLATMQFSSMWSVLFFAMVITLGIDSTFGGLESVITGLCDEYPRVLRAHRGIFIGLLIILIYLCSLPTTTYGGSYVIYLLESYGTSLSLLFIVLIETIIVCWLYGADKFCMNLEEMYGERPGAYWRICWKYISPTILLLIFTAACGQELDKYHTLSNGNYTFPGWAPTLGLLMTGSSVCCVPIYAIYYIKTKTSGTLLERLKIAMKPIESERQRESIGTNRGQEVMTDKIRDYNEARLDTNI